MPRPHTDPAVCPECANGKHPNCTGWAIDEKTDELVDCRCGTERHA
jgi:hypothetical protein